MAKRRRPPAIPVYGGPFGGSMAGPVARRIIGKIKITGPIMPATPSRFPQMRGASPDRIIQKLGWAKSRGLRGLIVEINSPGGAVVACKEIADAIKDLRIATVAWVRDVGASGGYWVASACKRIVADRCSTIGSIGVLSPHLEFSELMKKYGVKYEGFKAGAYKDMGIPFKKTTEKERKLIRDQLNKLHEMFIREVADNRGMEEKDMKKLSQGQVYLGEEAREAGLVDKLGGRAEAIRQCEITGNFRHFMVVDIEDFREEMMYFLRSLLAGGPFMPRWEVRDMLTEFFSHPGNFAL